jgi:hypothetical protein
MKTSTETSMSAKQSLVELLNQLPEDKVERILNFAREVSEDAERDDWATFGRTQFERAFGPDEPVYTVDDLKLDSAQ